MVGPDLQTVVHRLHQLASEGGAGSAADAELLGRFAAGCDAAAFELLVWRHGAMVLATCRRILGQGPDAEDAFQATFLALVRQAKSVRKSGSLGPWLHRVARRASLHTRRRNLRREQVERSLPMIPQVPSPFTPDLRDVMDEEVDRLPERLRRAVVLCYLDGHTTEDAARLLGVPRGTVLSRLARARDRLRGRFLRRGLAPAGAVASGLTGDALAVPLVESAVQNALHLANGSAALVPAVAALTEGVVRSMFLSKVKITAAGLILAAAVVGTGTVFVARPDLYAQPSGPAGTTGKAAPKPPAEPRSKLELIFPNDGRGAENEVKRLQGTWKVEKLIERGKEGHEDGMLWTFGPTTLSVVEGKSGPTVTMSYRVDPTADSKTIDLTHGGKTMAGIYRFAAIGADRFSVQVCLPNGKGPRPNSFAGTQDVTVFVLAPADEKTGKAQPAANDLETLKRENEQLAARIEVLVRQQQAYQAQIAEKERLALDLRDHAVVERKHSEDIRAREQDMAKRAELDRERAVAEMRSMQVKYETVLKEKETEIDALRAKMPLDKWDAGWSQIKIEIGSGWTLRILADGSGVYGTGALDDFCTFQAGTFAFDKVRRDVLARAKLDPNNAGCLVEMRRKNEPGSMVAYSNDGAFMVGLLQTAHAKATTASLDERWAKSPPKTSKPTVAPGGDSSRP